jgi:hypothetical protein
VRLTLATLCDAATLREGLLHILGAATNTVYRPAFPAPLGANLALNFLMTQDEVGVSHNLEVKFTNQDGQESLRVSLQLGPVTPEQLTSAHLVDDDEVGIPLVLPTAAAPITGPGKHRVTVQLDGDELVSLPVRAIQGVLLPGAIAPQPSSTA